ncbi:MAG: hypothetical protein KH405_07955 [Firmicutes bacterium]|nr:hypothetical protein [Bacillota bacterium]
MEKQNKSKYIQSFIEELNTSEYKKGRPWKGYEVYEPVYDDDVCIGLPYVILAKDDEVRISTDDEALEYLAFSLESGTEKIGDEEMQTDKSKR